MRATLPIKVAVVAVLAVTSSVVTSMVVTHLGFARAAQAPDAVPPPRTTTVVKEVASLPQAQPGERRLGGVFASGVVQLLNVEVANNTVHVTGRATIHDTRPHMQFIWALRVIDPADEKSVLFENFTTTRSSDCPSSNSWMRLSRTGWRSL